MAKEDKEDKKKKKGGGKKGLTGCFTGILAIVLIIVLLVSFIFAIFEAIIEFIKNVVLGIINGILNFLAHPIKSTIQALGALGNWLSENFNQEFDGWALEKNQPDQLIEISQDEFIAMRDAIDESISRDAAGLDDIMLKKMLLAYNTGKYSRNADIIIELTADEAEALKKEETQPFSVIKGEDLPQLDLNALDIAANRVNTFFDALFGDGSIFDSDVYKDAKDEREDKQDKDYLHANGVLKFVNEEDQELVYFDAEVLEKLYVDEFQANRYGASSDYAQSVWEYLSTKCYTDGKKGMKMYGHETVEEELIEWTFEDDDPDLKSFGDIFDLGDKALSNIAINRQIINENYLYKATDWISETRDLGFLGELLKDDDGDVLGMDGIVDTAIKTYEMQDLDYYSLVSQYTTPVEFMIDLLNISSSKEFVNAFIDKMTNESEVTLKIYRVSNSSSEEITEVTKEKATVKAEAVVSAEVVQYNNDFGTWHDGSKGATVTKIELLDKDIIWGLGDKLRVKVTVGNIPDEVEQIKLKITFKADADNPIYVLCPGDPTGVSNIFGDHLGSRAEITYDAWFNERFKTRSNVGTIKQYTTKLTTETKLDIAVEKAETWYGTFEYNNKIQKDTIYETINKNGRMVSSEGEPIMISKSVPTATYTRGVSNTSPISGDFDFSIFAEHDIEYYAWSEIGSRIESWYADLKADNVMFWVVPGGHLTHSLYTMYGDGGLQLCKDTDELLNIRLTYAMENGPADWWIDRYYLPVEMKCETQSYKIGHLYTTVNRYLEQGTPKVKDNIDFFLSLLKNDTGKYDRSAKYNPNGKEVVYKTVYDSEDRVARFFETSAEMLFNLLERSPHTQGLADVMRYTLYQYTTKDYGVTEFNFNIIDREGFEYI